MKVKFNMTVSMFLAVLFGFISAVTTVSILTPSFNIVADPRMNSQSMATIAFCYTIVILEALFVAATGLVAKNYAKEVGFKLPF